MASVTGSYTRSGYNPSLEIQNLRLDFSNGSISVSGTTASTVVSASLWVRRDSYGTSWNQTAACYITINGNKKTYNKYWESGDPLNSTYKKVMDHSVTVSWSASTSKTINLAAGFDMSSNAKLAGLVLPASSYSLGTASQSGSLSMTFPKQVTALGAPTSLSLTRNSGGSITLPNDTITISWSGASNGSSNSIINYQVYYLISSNGVPPNESYYTNTVNVPVSTGATSGSVQMTISNATRGYIITAAVKAFGTGGVAYCSSLKTGGWLTVNRLPGEPSVSASASTVKSTGNRVTFWASPGGDSDGQAVYTYYSRSSDGPKNHFSGSVELDIYNGNNAAYFYSYDGLEYSAPRTLWIGINDRPVINSLTINKNELSGNNGTSGVPLVRTIASSDYSLSKVVSSYRWYYATSSTSSVDISNPVQFSTSSSIGGYGFDGRFTRGHYYKIGLRVGDAYEESDIVWESGVSQLPLRVGVATNITVENSSSGYVAGTNSSQFNDSVKVHWTNPSVPSGALNIVSAKPYYTVIGGSTSYVNTNGSLTPSVSTEVGFSLSPSRGAQVRFGVQIIDSGDSNSNTIGPTLTRANLPYFANTTLSITGPEENGAITFRPYINTTPLGLTSMKVTSDNGAKYYADCVINDKNVTISLIQNKDKTEIETGDSALVTISAENINTLLKDSRLKGNPDDPVWNDNFTNVIYRFYVIDSFGNTSSNYATTKVTSIAFIQPPTFTSSENIEMGIQYYLPNLDSSNYNLSIKYPSVESTLLPKERNNDRMFNPGEAVVFRFSLPYDYNNDVTSYQIYVSRMDDRPESVSKNEAYEEYSYVFLTEFLPDAAKTEGSKLVYQYPIVSYLQNKFLTFYIVAKDSKGNLSNKIYSNTYLVGCRQQNPTVTLKSAAVDDTNKIIINYEINDLGGSQFANSIYKYKADSDDNSYPNFEREISIKLSSDTDEITYLPKSFIHIQYCLDGNFSNTSNENYSYQIIPLSGEYSDLGGTILSNDIEDFGGKKLYIRLKFVLLTGFGTSNENYEEIGDFTKNNIVSSITEIITYYPNMPTVSHRSHHVGINTNVFSEEDDEVLVISDFMDRSKVIFIGTDTSTGEAKEFKIIINLKNGTIDGARISGGSWDS